MRYTYEEILVEIDDQRSIILKLIFNPKKVWNKEIANSKRKWRKK